MVPNIKNGSHLKRQIHRICIQMGIITQFISDQIFYNDNSKKQRNISWGMMSDIMHKIGCTLYRIIPSLPHFNSRINISSTMILGLDVCHPTKVKTTKHPSIAVMTSFYDNNDNTIFNPKDLLIIISSLINSFNSINDFKIFECIFGYNDCAI